MNRAPPTLRTIASWPGTSSPVEHGRARPAVLVEIRRPPRGYYQMVRGWYDPVQRLIVVYRHPLWDPLGVELTLVHELAHASGRPGCVGHRRGFRRILVREARERLGVDLGDPAEVAARCRSVAEVEREVYWALLRVRLVGVARRAWSAVRGLIGAA